MNCGRSFDPVTQNPAFQVRRLFSFLLHYSKLLSAFGDRDTKSNNDYEMWISSDLPIQQLDCPSQHTNALTLHDQARRTLKLTQAGRHMGRNDRLFGQIGTISIVLTQLWMIGPPADRAQAVDPVGVEIRIPSPDVVVKSWSPMKISNRSCDWLSNLLIATSFRHQYFLSAEQLGVTFVQVSLILDQVLHCSLPPDIVAPISSKQKVSISSSLNLHMNPKVPISKETKSGVDLLWNSLFPNRIVPSPPTVITQLIISQYYAMEYNQLSRPGNFAVAILRQSWSVKQSLIIGHLDRCATSSNIIWLISGSLCFSTNRMCAGLGIFSYQSIICM